MEKGNRIKFLTDIYEGANGDHPPLQFAKKGDLGTINEKLKDGWYSVFSDGWKYARFLVKEAEFELLPDVSKSVCDCSPTVAILNEEGNCKNCGKTLLKQV